MNCSDEVFSSWCRHQKEERERSGDIQITVHSDVRKQKLSGNRRFLGKERKRNRRFLGKERERKLGVKRVKRGGWSGERREQAQRETP